MVQTGHDFSQRDRILPHPVYGWMCWIAVLNPSHETFEEVKPLLSALVLILTAVDESAGLSNTLEAGAAGYVLKDAPAARIIRRCAKGVRWGFSVG